jgi:hypothetical protein
MAQVSLFFTTLFHSIVLMEFRFCFEFLPAKKSRFLAVESCSYECSLVLGKRWSY